MNGRRQFLKFASLAAVPASGIGSPREFRVDADNRVVGTWNVTHTLPFPPGSFREFLSFSEGGVLHETNSFLHIASNLDFSAFGLPNVVNASDGQGNWVRSRRGEIEVVFRKLLFDASRQNFADLHLAGRVRTDGDKLYGDWQVQVVDLEGGLVLDFGPATTEGVRLS